MAKETYHIGLYYITNPYRLWEPLSLTAGIGNDTVQVNFQTEGIEGKELTKYWAKHPEVWERINQQKVPVQEGLRIFTSWLSRYEGRHIAVCSGLEFYQLFHLLVENMGKFSFGSNGHLDYTTLLAIRSENPSLRGPKFLEKADPLERVLDRANVVKYFRQKSVGKIQPSVNAGGSFQAIKERFMNNVPQNWVYENVNVINAMGQAVIGNLPEVVPQDEF